MDLEGLQDLFKLLGNESRLKILQLLWEKSYCGEELAQMLNLTSATISHHMKRLEDAGLVSSQKEQYYTNYYLNDALLSRIIQADLLKEKPLVDSKAEERHSEYRQKILRDFFNQQGKLKTIPSQRKKREIILEKLVESFELGRQYTEQEVNLTLAMFHDDFCTLRREMIGYRLMERKEGIYWRIFDDSMESAEVFTLKDLLRVLEENRKVLNPFQKAAEVAQYHRIQNSPGMDGALDEMATYLVEAGLETSIECFHANGKISYQDYLVPGGWVGHSGSLRVADSEEILADFTRHPLEVIQRSTSIDGVQRLEVYPVDDLQELIEEQPDLQGKIILTRENVHKVKDLLHDPCNAQGIIFDGMRDVLGRNLEEMATARQYTSFWWQPGERRTFGYVLSPAKGKEIRERIGRGEEIWVECRMDTEEVNNPLKVLHAKIPGQSDENLLLVAHICHPYQSANDNASGVAAAVEGMLFLQRMIQEKKLPQPRRGIELLLMPEYSGTFAFLDRHLQEGNYVGGVNLDMVGEDQEKCGSTLTVEAPPFSSTGLTGDLLYYILQEVMKNPTIRLDKALFQGGSDHALLSDPDVNIPCTMLNQRRDRYYHTDQDTIDKLDSLLLQDVTLATAIYIYYLANAHLPEIQEILEIYLQGYVTLGKREIKEFFQQLTDGNQGEQFWCFAHRRLDWIFEHYLQVIDYFKKFIEADEFNYFQKTASDWQERCEQERRLLVEKLNQGFQKRMKVKIDVNGDVKRQKRSGLTEAEKKLTRVIPERKFWGFSLLSHKRQGLSESDLSELWQIMDDDRSAITVQAQYWVDGQRNLYEIMELVELETGKREPGYLLRLFRLLEKVGSVMLKEGK